MSDSVTGGWREPRTPTGRKLAAQTTLGSTIVAIEREAVEKFAETLIEQFRRGNMAGGSCTGHAIGITRALLEGKTDE